MSPTASSPLPAAVSTSSWLPAALSRPESSNRPSPTIVAKAQTGAQYQGFVPKGYVFKGAVTLDGGSHGKGRFELYYNTKTDAWAAVSPNGKSVTLFRPGSLSKDEVSLSLIGKGPLDVTFSVTNCKTQRCPPDAPTH
jgi:hypothetical protein